MNKNMIFKKTTCCPQIRLSLMTYALIKALHDQSVLLACSPLTRQGSTEITWPNKLRHKISINIDI